MYEGQLLSFVIMGALVLVAWLRGWKGWALLPPALPLIVGFGMGIALTGQAGEIDGVLYLPAGAWAVCVVSGLLAWLALIVMAIVGRRSK